MRSNYQVRGSRSAAARIMARSPMRKSLTPSAHADASPNHGTPRSYFSQLALIT